MESKVKLMGHPIHPMLIVFPLGLFVSAVILDIVYLVSRNPVIPTIAYWDIAIGLAGGLLAAIFGTIDWASIPSGTRAKSVGMAHGLGNAVLVLLFLASWLIRSGQPGYTPPTLALIFSFAGVLLGTMTAWLGGELVDRMGVGVDPGAHLDAPSSLTREPAFSPSMQALPVAGRGEGRDLQQPGVAEPMDTEEGRELPGDPHHPGDPTDEKRM